MIKVHYAGMDGDIKASIARESCNVHYGLYSVYPFISKKTKRKLEPDNPIKIDQKVCKHIIQDSGLYTLMFGAGKGQRITKAFLETWQEKLIDFVKENGITASCVEIDCQKVLGVKEAWYFREKMKKTLPNEQINVFHYEDGLDGLNRLIDFSEYIAISVPELRIIKRKTFRKDTRRLVEHILTKKPEMKIHLLGCTDIEILKQNKECYSSDSSSWLYGIMHNQFGIKNIKGRREHISRAKYIEYEERVKRKAKEYGVDLTKKGMEYTTCLAINGAIFKQSFEKYVGNQD